ncbi:hypothetical protein jhhlp_008083 [Lomentospora prolificans]|uniref:Zn(2)-C6 fungal-type domain-containing protein n=1 Tax=Lomentospora prolificans TaxID=41688 RepID=A0A2N3MZH2_9PEZI|nr:hypothetical protein jhhlp_008083 [Lomentospora prolificans]
MMNGVIPPPRQIRFVHNQGQPPSKRRRINAACLTCRRRKTRCAGERPFCSTCTKNGHTCQGYSDILEKKKESGGTGDGRRGSSTDFTTHDEIDYEDDNEDERRHSKSKLSAAQHTISPTGGSGRRRSLDSGLPRGAILERRHTINSPSERADLRRRSQGANLASGLPAESQPEIRRVPYFRYFGPTAIVPGFKQMVVSVKNRRRSNTAGSLSGVSPSPAIGNTSVPASLQLANLDDAIADDCPVYDPNDGAPVPELILDLVDTFFLHLGCNYPFLKRDRFYDLVMEKRVEPILVDAVCALAARFSDSAIFTRGKSGNNARAEYGHFYAQRAKASTVDTFPCPSVGAVQACLLMAYEGFGANQDSALWMYLGLAIRMAVDLGLQKVVGVKYQGEKDPWYTRNWNRPATVTDIETSGEDVENEGGSSAGDLSPIEQREVEQERIDTFWAVFTLDRVISSGTGRPVTFRDDDFELSLPEPLIDPTTGWPDPYPHFVRIIHLYGRVSDVLNNIRNAKDLTSEKWKKLSEMETELTKQHQALDQRLEFNAGNFRAYVDAGQGTTFILLHFWFHALIIILHQPTLLAPFGGLSRTHQLLPNSRELSMSSAKTIADILSFAELIDPKSFIGNPFTSQPMYIAACAFLMDSVARASKPDLSDNSRFPDPKTANPPPKVPTVGQANPRAPNKHSLLASAANKNYQRCYNSLAQLHTYWGGVKYILTALDQKSEGIWDVETYTYEEYESTKPVRRGSMSRFPGFDHPVSPNAPPIAWSLTGTSNSPSSNLTFMYQNMATGPGIAHQPTQAPRGQLSGDAKDSETPPGSMVYDPIRQSGPHAPSMFPPAYPQPTISAIRKSPHPAKPRRQLSAPSVPILQTPTKGMRHFEGRHMPPDDITTPPPSVDQTPKMNVLGAMPHQTYTPSSHSSAYDSSVMQNSSPIANMAEQHQRHQQRHQQQQQHAMGGSSGSTATPIAGSAAYGNQGPVNAAGYHGANIQYMPGSGGHVSDVITFDSQEIDINALGLQNEMMPTWLEYLPVMNIFDGSGMGGGGSSGGGG